MSGTNGVNGSGNKFQLPNFWSKPSLHTAKTEEITSSTPIKFTGLNTVKRENLDELSPYAAMGVKFSAKAPVGSVESYMAAAPEFSRWQGNFGPLGKKDLATLDNLSNVYAKVAENKADVTEHLQDCPFDFFTA
ncbi:hypothetical protein IJ674_01400 [bacterium]|nr:hypothetical protein [bacterium]